ncbi:MAG: cysteine hydrolase [Sphaerochaetaceae bacterium]|nr:cysteine hydrolase [Sphaerochaetaceae bacterium]
MKKALVVVDYQNDFVNGALGFPGAEKIDSIIASKIKRAASEGDDVIFTLDTHHSDYLKTSEGRHLPAVHCIEGTEGWQLFGETAKQASSCHASFLKKGQFGSLELGRILSEGAYDLVELCGLVCDICVVSNALIAKAALPEARIVVDSSATASFDPEAFKAALKVMRSCQIEII